MYCISIYVILYSVIWLDTDLHLTAVHLHPRNILMSSCTYSRSSINAYDFSEMFAMTFLRSIVNFKQIHNLFNIYNMDIIFRQERVTDVHFPKNCIEKADQFRISQYSADQFTTSVLSVKYTDYSQNIRRISVDKRHVNAYR